MVFHCSEKGEKVGIKYRLYSVGHAENFHGGVSFSGIWWSFVFGVRFL